jgi:hypothetical protein
MKGRVGIHLADTRQAMGGISRVRKGIYGFALGLNFRCLPADLQCHPKPINSYIRTYVRITVIG